MDPVLYDLLVTRLLASPPTDGDAEDLILTACEGRAALDQALEGGAARRHAATATPATPATHMGVYLDSITVEGFRGVGERTTMSLSPFPGLTLVVGRNGSGKSSFAEALELLLTGANRRWQGRSEIWKEGWRNLHHPSTSIEADFITAGRSGRMPIRREWPADAAEPTQGVTTVSGRPDDGTLATLGWAQPLAMYRPFLPHSELGALWDEGPARLHDALAAILGLEDLTVLIRTLGEARLEREQSGKRAVSDLAALRTELEAVDDDRARACLAATATRRWDLDAVAVVLEETGDGGGAATQRELALLRDLAALPCPSAVRVAERVAALREVAARLVAVAATDSGRAHATAALLRTALEHVRTHDGTACPVCGTPGATGEAWRAATSLEVERLTAQADEAERVRAAERAERQLATALIGTMPGVLRQRASVGIDTEALLGAWTRWATVDPAIDTDGLAAHLDSSLPDLDAATAAVRAAAATDLARREDAWRPVAQRARSWLDTARAAVAAERIKTLKAAEAWVKAAEKELRAERFTPIAKAVQGNWAMLRQDSSVILDTLRLEGTRSSNLRRVVLDVSIDGAAGAALGVMSQGELNALALSLFLPRASLPDSPFRFIVIDDPVQAMDPNKVDGLARVLEQAAGTHQVIVFTHDERLPAAVRRLGIEATVIDVVRREGSVVELRPGLDPVHRHIDDALAVARDDDLPVSAGRVVPTFCRMALEAACAEAVMRRRLARGDRVADIEQLLANTQQLNVRLALALYDDSGQAGRVALGIVNKWGEDAGTVVRRCNLGAHRDDTGDQVWLCTRTRWLAELIQTLP